MKRYILPLFFFIIAISGCRDAQPVIEEHPTPIDRVETDINGLKISFDKRMEMLEVIQYLSGSFLVNDQDILYKKRIEEYFGEYRDHPAVKMYSKMQTRGFGYNIPPTALLSADENFNMVKEIDEYYVIRAAGGMRKLNKWLSLLKDFDQKTDFNKFMNESADLHRKSLDMLIDSAFIRRDQIPVLEKFYGYGQKSYNIYLTPLSIGGYGPRVSAEGGLYDVYDIQGPWGKPVDGITSFGNEEQLIGIVWHEFSHSFVNPLYAKYDAQFMEYKSLLEPISSQMNKIGYPSWDIVVYEHIVRAITSYLIAQEYGPERGNAALEKEKSHDFIYIDAVYAAVERYASDRSQWKDFRDFFPEFIKVFKSLDSEDSSGKPVQN